MKLRGSLCAGMQHRVEYEKRGLGVLVIDMQPTAAHAMQTHSIQQVLHFANTLGCFVWFIEMQNEGHTPGELLSCVTAERRSILEKPDVNAFHKTMLDAGLQAKEVSALVVMGSVTNVCVKETVLGGYGVSGSRFWQLLGAPRPVQRGYRILTCADVRVGDAPADWIGEQGIDYYETV